MSEQTPDLAERLDTSDSLDAEIVNEVRTFPELLESAPDLLPQVRNYYALLQIEYTRRAGEIEKFLGFVESCEELSVRLRKLEQFLGIAS